MSSGTVRVLLFAGARDVAGVRELELPVPAEGTTVEAIATEVVRRFPALAGYLRSLRLAVNGEYAGGGVAVRAGDEIAVIPPVAGG
jgi:molybdopterin converting factor subunit 1